MSLGSKSVTVFEPSWKGILFFYLNHPIETPCLFPGILWGRKPKQGWPYDQVTHVVVLCSCTHALYPWFVQCSAVAILKLILMFEEGHPAFPLCTGPPKLCLSPSRICTMFCCSNIILPENRKEALTSMKEKGAFLRGGRIWGFWDLWRSVYHPGPLLPPQLASGTCLVLS